MRLVALTLNGPARTPGAPAPAKLPRLATLGVGRAHRAFAAGGDRSEAGPVRLPSQTRTRSCHQSAAPGLPQLLAQVRFGARREDPAAAPTNPSAGFAAANWWRRDCRA